MVKGRTTLDTAKRADIYYEAQKNVVEEAPLGYCLVIVWIWRLTVRI